MSSPTRRPASIVHVMVLDKFIPRFIEFVGEHFDLSAHRFCLIGSPRFDHGLNADHPVEWVSNEEDQLRLVEHMHRADRIVLHGLWSEAVNRILYALPALARKAHWNIWGGDLYQPIPSDPSPNWLHQEIVRRGVISQLGGLIGIPGDTELAQKRYGGHANHLNTFMYPSNLAPRHAPPPADHPGTRILVGNSATESNCHLDAFARIASHGDARLEVHCPLTYGDMKYRELVIANGRALFGERFHPITEMMPLAAYNDFLAGIDIAVMHHNRQQGMGNLISLLAMGKKVYMRPEQAHARFFQQMGVATCDLRDFDPAPLPSAVREHNIQLTQAHFSADRLASDLAVLFAQPRRSAARGAP